MAPNKFDQHIKEELNKREIRPSEATWGKISRQLDEPKQQRKPKYLWWGIAAGFAGLLIVSTIFINTEKSDVETTIVDTDKDRTELKKENNDTRLEHTKENQIVNTTIKNREESEALDSDEIKLKEPNNYPLIKEINKVAIVNPIEVSIDEDHHISQEDLIQQKIAEVITKVNQLEQNENTLTDLEVDSLILQAQKEILRNKIFRQVRSVDAMALLNEVEDELNKPLKDQLFDLLKKGIFETRNAIADRN